MNNPEVTMQERQNRNGFDTLDKATEAAGIAISLVMRVPAPLKPIADQVSDPGNAHPRFLDPPASWLFLMPSRQGNPEMSSGAIAIPQSSIGSTDDHFPSLSAPEHAGNTAHRGVPKPPLSVRAYGLHRGVPGLILCLRYPSGCVPRSAQCLTGQPPR